MKGALSPAVYQRFDEIAVLQLPITLAGCSVRQWLRSSVDGHGAARRPTRWQGSQPPKPLLNLHVRARAATFEYKAGLVGKRLMPTNLAAIAFEKQKGHLKKHESAPCSLSRIARLPFPFSMTSLTMAKAVGAAKAVPPTLPFLHGARA